MYHKFSLLFYCNSSCYVYHEKIVREEKKKCFPFTEEHYSYRKDHETFFFTIHHLTFAFKCLLLSNIQFLEVVDIVDTKIVLQRKILLNVSHII